MACQNCNSDCSTIEQLLILNNCLKTNSSKPTGFFISSYVLPALSSYASYDPQVPAPQPAFVADLLARLSNTNTTDADAIRCYCASGTIAPLELPSVENCTGENLYGSAKLELDFLTYDFSAQNLAFLNDISNCNRSVYLYIKTEDLLIGAYEGEGDGQCFVPFQATIRRTISFEGNRGEVNSIQLKLTTTYIKDVVFIGQEYLPGLNLTAKCDTYN